MAARTKSERTGDQVLASFPNQAGWDSRDGHAEVEWHHLEVWDR